jgi:hypothetical protein
MCKILILSLQLRCRCKFPFAEILLGYASLKQSFGEESECVLLSVTERLVLCGVFARSSAGGTMFTFFIQEIFLCVYVTFE